MHNFLRNIHDREHEFKYDRYTVAVTPSGGTWVSGCRSTLAESKG